MENQGAMIKRHYLLYLDNVMYQNILAEFLNEFGLQLLSAKIESDCVSVKASLVK
jgi:hypothetical protein